MSAEPVEAVLDRALRLRGDAPALIGHIGDGTGDALGAPALRTGDRRVDLERIAAHGGPLLNPSAGASSGAAQPARQRDGPDSGEAAGLVAVVAATLADLRRAVTLGGRLPRTHQVVAVLPGSSGRHEPPLPAAPGLGQWRELQEARVRRLGGDGGGWACELYFLEPVDPGGALHAIAAGALGRRSGTPPTPAAALSGTDAPSWLPGRAQAIAAPPEGPVPRYRNTPLADVALRTVGPVRPEWADDEVPVLDRLASDELTWSAISGPQGPRRIRRAGLGEGGTEQLPPVDEAVVNPVGFVSDAGRRVGRLVSREGRLAVTVGREVVARLPASGAVTEAEPARLRGLRAVSVDWSGHSGPLAAMRAVAGLAAAGVPLCTEEEAPGWAAPLGSELLALLASTTAEDLADRLVRERHSIALRRCALRAHSVSARWRALGERSGAAPAPEPRVSVLLCTRRPELVGFALEQIGRQRGVELEAVLALHGFGTEAPGVAGAVERFAAGGREITVCEADRGEVFGSLLNRAAARARGELLAKWDDDDFYGPHHLADLLLARSYASADVVGCGPEFVYLEEIDRTVWRPGESERAAPFVSGGSLLTDRVVLEECGGFRPLPRAVDTQLLLAVGAAGGRVYRTHAHNYLVRRRSSGHTWVEHDGSFLRDSLRQWPGRRPAGLAEHEPTDGGGGAEGDTGGRGDRESETV
ncbi:glycosyltransferase [Streptomonospora alba]|uniref:glycosyltransferase n=1 Tax=Streptomonospora alba TaxID=183763 RepID=UPI000AA21A6B|nr:glycosyltransferase [Streptomonospora alba]